MIRETLLLLFLGIHAVLDVRQRSVPVWSLLLSGMAGTGLSLWTDRMPLQFAAGLLPGLFLLAAGRCTDEAVGYGDGLAVLVTGCYLGLWQTCETVMAALVLSAVWGGVLMVVKRAGRKQEFPWLPFLLLAYAGRMVIG